MNDIVVHTITKRRINKTINNKSVGNTRINRECKLNCVKFSFVVSE